MLRATRRIKRSQLVALPAASHWPTCYKFLQAVEQRARERQVAVETVKILRQRVIECYRYEGVNHYENCKVQVQDYCNIINKKDHGQLHPNWENPEKHDGWR